MDMSAIVIGLMTTGIVIVLALLVITQMQSLSVITAESYAANATTNVLSGLNVFSTLFPLFAIVAGIIILLGYLSFGRGKK